MNVLDRIEGFAFVLAAVIAEAIGQLAFKRAADGSNFGGYIAQRKWFFAGIAAFIVEGLLWTCALKFLPVTVAQPTSSVELIFVAVLARVFLKEQITPRRWIGVAFILGGVVLVGAA